MKPLVAVMAACRANLSDDDDASLAAQLVDSFLPIGNGWTLVAAVHHGERRLVARIVQEPIYDTTTKLLRLHDFNKALSIAVAVGDISFAKILVKAVPNARITSAIGIAARCGQLEFLDWIYKRFVDACWGGAEMTKAARFGQLTTLIWLQNNTVRLGPQHLLANAARHLSSDVLTWVLEHRGEEPELSDLIVAVEHGRLENLEILAAQVQPTPRIPALHAARNGHLHVIKWLHDNNGVFTKDTMDIAAQYGHLDVLIWLRDNRSEGCSMRAVSFASMSGHLSVVKWLVDKYPGRVSPGALLLAVGNGHTQIAQWLHQHVKITWTGNIVESATRHGSRELITWTMGLYPYQWTPTAMDNVALAGNKEMFFAFHHAGKTCTTAAVDYFAAQGDVTMVRWAYRNRPEGCSSNAMDAAAANGHLEVLKFLHGQDETFTVLAMNGAAANGHLEVLKWLRDQCSDDFAADAMDEAANHGHLGVVKWLHSQGAACTEYAMDAAAANGHFEVVIFLHSERNEGCSRRASLWAADYGHLEILQWLRINYPRKFDVNATIRAAPTYGWGDELLQDLCRF